MLRSLFLKCDPVHDTNKEQPTDDVTNVQDDHVVDAEHFPVLAGMDHNRVCQDALSKDSCRDEVKLAIGCPDLVEMNAIYSNQMPKNIDFEGPCPDHDVVMDLGDRGNPGIVRS